MTIRVLVTGFSEFPGAPYNPSERLVRLLEQRRPDFGRDVVVETALLETSYATVCERLAELASRGCADIALHFGLARTAKGFRLERLARNLISSPLPDVAGHALKPGAFCEGPECYGSSLPLDTISQALAAQGIPAEFSDDAGGYVCNFTFYHSRGGLVADFRPPMSGFIHIPYLEDQVVRIADSELLPRLSEQVLWAGALTIIRTCASSFARTRNSGSAPASETVASSEAASGNDAR